MSSEPGAVTCAGCGRPLAPYERYCGACGRPRPEATSAGEGLRPPDAPRYQSPPGSGSPPPEQPPPGESPTLPPHYEPPHQMPAGYPQPANQPYRYPPTYAPPEPRGGGLAVASLVLGILSLIAWLLPIAGLPVAIVGLILGILGRGSRNRGMATGGIITSSIGLGLSLINAILGAIFSLQG